MGIKKSNKWIMCNTQIKITKFTLVMQVYLVTILVLIGVVFFAFSFALNKLYEKMLLVFIPIAFWCIIMACIAMIYSKKIELRISDEKIVLGQEPTAKIILWEEVQEMNTRRAKADTFNFIFDEVVSLILLMFAKEINFKVGDHEINIIVTKNKINKISRIYNAQQLQA